MKMKYLIKTLIILMALSLCFNSYSQTGPAVQFIGTDGNWFDPTNWDSGVLPDATTDIIISNADVFIDATLSPNPIEIRDLTLENDKTLNLMNGTQFTFRNAYIEDGLLELHSSTVNGNDMTVSEGDSTKSANRRPGGWGCTHCGIVLGNPSFFDIGFQSYHGILAVGLGGNQQASVNNSGSGYYAHFIGDDIELGGDLLVQEFYGFVPVVGETYQIITARNTLTGQFNNLNEGSVLTTANGIDLRISYRGGDGNDVVLTAIQTSVRFIGSDGNWFDPNNWDSGVLPDATTDVVLTANQSVVIDPTLAPNAMDALIVINYLTLDQATLTTLPNTIFQYNKLIMDDASLFDTKSSEIIGNELEINRNGTEPGGFGVKFNPTTNDNRSIKITANTSKLHMFLGGLTPASTGNVGLGHYAHLSADDIELNGRLMIDTIYGFEPQVGDVFEIITARNSLMGQFNGLDEGDVVTTLADVDLVISYPKDMTGATTGVVLTAVQIPFRLQFSGTDGDWFNPANWLDVNTGQPANRVPTRDDDIIIDSAIDVFIDPPAANNTIEIRNLTLANDRTLNLMNQSEFIFNKANVKDGLLEFHSSIVTGNEINSSPEPTTKSINKRPGGWGCSHCGVVLGNPSFVDIDNQSFSGILAVGLGGIQQASSDHTGAGYYAHFIGNEIELAGDLLIQEFYGFTPIQGDVFEIITARNSLTGQFSNLPEGGLITTVNGFDLIISYQGGDGNDVILTAIQTPDIIFKNDFE
jgi:molybdopterin-binding protein